MKNLIYIFIVVAIIIAYGFTQRETNVIPSENSENSVLSVSGEMLYQKNCAACHGIDQEGKPPTFPELVTIENRMDKEHIIRLLSTGRNAMPSFSHLSEQERLAIAGYLHGEFTESEVVTKIAPVENGKNTFVANCSGCHKATTDDLQPPDQRNWGMKPAILGGINKKYDITDFKNILNSGPCYMPSFDYLNIKDKEDIYAYLKTFEELYIEEKSYSTRGCNMRCGNH